MDSYTYYTFYITCCFLVTTGTITFIEALRTNIVPMRHILNLETCISIVAAYFYGNFIKTLEPYKDQIIEENIQDTEKLQKLENKLNDTRYVDWMITTPIMLLVLILAFKYNAGSKDTIKFTDFLLILLFNYGMLGTGYLGEKGIIHKLNANIIGFVFFGLLYGFMYNKYLLKMKNGNNKTNQLLFLCFLILWAFYGIFYLMKESIKNTGYNILDLLSKCFVGIYFWTYSSKIFN